VTDVVIVGAGPTGLACGIELKKRGVRAVLLDKGCVVNSLYHYPQNMVFFTTPELLEIGDIPMTSLNDKPNRVEGLKYYRRVADHYELDIRQYERVERITGEDGAFVTVTSRGEHRSKKVNLATGYYDIPNLLGVPGEELPKVIHYYKEAHPYYDQDVLVVGAKNSAAIAALELWWTGARVTLVHRGAGIHPHVKYWIGITLNTETGRPAVNAETYESARPGMYLAGVVVAGVHTSEIFIENGRFHGGAIARDIAAKVG